MPTKKKAQDNLVLRTSIVPALLAVMIAIAGCGGDEGVGPKVQDHSVYTIESSFNVQGDFGDAGLGGILNMLRDMSDDDNDPGKFIVDELIEFLPTPINWAAEPLADELGSELNQVIYELIPTVAEEIEAISTGLSNAARQFEMVSTLDVGLDSKDRFTGTHEIKKLVYSYNQQRLEFAGADLGENVAPVDRIPIHMESGLLTIDIHTLSLPVGTMLTQVLDGLVIPTVIVELVDLESVILRWFACAEVARTVAEVIDGAEDLILSACTSASHSIATDLMNKLYKLDRDSGLRLYAQTSAEADGITYQDSGWSGVYIVGSDTKAPLDPDLCPFVAQETSE